MNLSVGKGVDILLNTVPKFLKKHPDYRFSFAGEGFLKFELLKLKKQSEHINVLGQLDHRSVLSLISRAKLLVFPSVWPEPFGRVILEAISLGVPVVVSERGGLAETVNAHGWGIVTSPDQLDSAIERGLIQNKKIRDQIKKDFPLLRKTFQDDVTDAYLKLYNSLLS